MSADAITAEVIDGLNRSGVPWMLVGSFSSNYYGLPRTTQDADFVLHLQDRSIHFVMDTLGPAYRLDPQMSFETSTATKRFVVRHPTSAFIIEFFLLGDEPHDVLRFERRKQVQLSNRTVFLPTVEDVIVTKVHWAHAAHRLKDEDDVRNILLVQAGNIDWPYVESWCDRHGSRPTLERIRAELAD